MKTIQFLALCILFCTLQVHSQGILQPEWTLLRSSNMPNGNAEAWAINSDSSGNLIWGVNEDMPGFFEYMDALILKLDTDKNILWTDTAITGQYAQQSFNLKITDSLVYAGGRSCSSLGTDNCDALFFTTTINGITGWNTVWDGGFGYEEIDGIALEPDGIYTTGWSAGDGYGLEVLLMKLDYSGNIIWQNTWGSPGLRDDHQDGHIVVDDSAIYISGLYSGSPVLGWDGRALLAKFSKINGSLIDSTTYGRNDYWINAENALSMATDGTYLYVTGYTTPSPGNWDLFAAKFDKNLNQLWYTTWGGAEAESARAITTSSDGSVYIGGVTKSFGSGEEDVVLLKYKSDGELQWVKTWGAEKDDHTLDIHINDSYLFLTGKTNSFHPNQKWDAILLKILIDSASTIYNQPLKNVGSLRLYPNPAGQHTTLTYFLKKNENISISLVDIFGQTLEEIVINEARKRGKHTQIISLPVEYPPGIYTIVLSTSTTRMQAKLIKR